MIERLAVDPLQKIREQEKRLREALTPISDRIKDPLEKVLKQERRIAKAMNISSVVRSA